MIEAHRTPEDMVRCLVTYIKDDARVLHEVRSTFDSTMGVQTIREIRRRKENADTWMRQGRDAADSRCVGWDWRGDQHRADMEMASRVFVRAIALEGGYP